MKFDWSRPALVYDPKEDITVYEIALCLKILIANARYSRETMISIWEALPWNAKRHFYLKAST